MPFEWRPKGSEGVNHQTRERTLEAEARGSAWCVGGCPGPLGSGEEWGDTIGGFSLGTLKGIKGRSWETDGGIDQDGGCGNIERCLDLERPDVGVRERKDWKMAPTRRGLDDWAENLGGEHYRGAWLGVVGASGAQFGAGENLRCLLHWNWKGQEDSRILNWWFSHISSI